MPNYRRYRVPGGCYFFTVNLLERKNALLVDAWVVLPEHMHTIWTLPEGDEDFSGRWKMIKTLFSKGLLVDERRSPVRIKRGERGIWQRRYWEHCIRDERDYENHMDYLHFNPVKHGWVTKVSDWPYSSFHRYVKQGVYPSDWVGDRDLEIDRFER